MPCRLRTTLDQLRDALEQSRASREIIEALGREGDSSGRILDTIVERSARLCRADAGQLYLLEGDLFRQTRTWGISAEFRQYVRGHPVQLSRSSLIGRVALDRRTQQIADVMNGPGVRPPGPRPGGRIPHPARGADAAR